jgi:diguanylate cyclase (GGDEF)-like protein
MTMKPKPKPRQSPQGDHVISFPLGTHPASEALRERLARAILRGNKDDLNQTLCELAKISVPSDSPEEFFRVMAGLLVRTARCAIQQRVVQEELRNLALTDDLTGLYNRRGFFALAEQQLKLARRNHEGALLFFADIDGLKQINDRLGHSEGDVAIMRVARILRDTFRDSDIVARLGGDEFSILANEASSDSQKDIWRRLKENLSAEGSRDPRYSLSLSIGVARFDPRSAVTLRELLGYADQAMYEAKRTSAEVRPPRGAERDFVSRISPEESSAGNGTSPANAGGTRRVPATPKPARKAKVTFLFANLPGRTRPLVVA